MCQALAARHEVRVVSPVAWTETLKPKDPLSPVTDIDVDYCRYYFPPRVLHGERGRFMWWSLRRHLLEITKRWKPDLVLAYWAHPDGEAALRWRAHSGTPVVQVVGGTDVLLFQHDARRWARVYRVLTSADAVVTIGQHLAAEVVRLGVPAERVFSVYRPVDADHFSPGSQASARSRVGLDEQDRVILWVGRFVKVKGLDVLMDAFARVRAALPRARLCLVGEGPECERIRERARELGLTDAVRFVGAVAHDDLVYWYRAADVTVLPSLSEGVPNVLLESMACGTPFVASNVGGIPEIADGLLDRLVAPGESAPLAAGLLDRLSTAVLRPRAVLPGTPLGFAQQLESVFALATARPAVAS